jgi:hypothetical protein
MITLGLYGRNLDSYEYYHMDEGYWIETAKWTFNVELLQ